MNKKIKFFSASILCSLSSLSFAEKWDGQNEQIKAWNTPNPKVKIIPDSLYTPDYRAAPVGMTGTQLKDLKYLAEYATKKYKKLELPIPRNEVENDEFKIYLVEELGNATGQYGAAYYNLPDFVRREKSLVRLSNSETFTHPQDWKLHPYKIGQSVAHEIFHAIVAGGYTLPEEDKNNAYDGEWFTEGFPDALSAWTIRGAIMTGIGGFTPESAFKTGHCRYAKAVGMRPYDYPLNLSSYPEKSPMTQCMAGSPSGTQWKQQFAYQSSSFWRFIFDDSMPSGKEFSLLHDFMNRPPIQAKSRDEAFLKFTDEGLKKYHPAWKRGLYDAYPAFINKWVHYPEDTMKSNQGFFAEKKWLEYLFADGCKTAEIGHSFINSVEIQTKIRANAATCIKIKWVDSINPRPIQILSRLEIANKTDMNALEGIRLGTHGTAYGDLLYEYFADDKGTMRLRSMPARAVGLVPFKPYKPERSGNEIIYIITNMQKDPVKTRDENVILILSLAEAQAQGSLTHTQYSNDPKDPPPPPSKPEFTGKRNPHNGVIRNEDESIQIEIITGAAGDQVTSKCHINNVPNMETSYEGANWTENAKSCGVAMKNRKDIVEVDLAIPYIPLGKTGNISGAEVTVKWYDPHPKLGDLSFSTDQVTLSIEQNNADVVKGKFTANYNQVDSAASTGGQVTGQFAVNLLNDETRDKAISNDTMDALPTDWWMAQAIASHGTLSTDFMRQIQTANMVDSSQTFGEIQGRKIIHKGKKQAVAVK